MPLASLQAQHWGDCETQRVMRLRFVPAMDDFNAWKYAKLTSVLELNYHCRSAMVNALNELHAGHSLSGMPGKLVGGDVLQEDHVMQAGIIASTAVQPKEWEGTMETRMINLGMRRQLLRTLAQKEWSALSVQSTHRQASSVAYEVALLSRGFERAAINRPDSERTEIWANELGWLLKAHILKMSERVCAVAVEVPCFAYVFPGLQPVLVNVAALTAGQVEVGEAMQNGAVLLGVTRRPAGVLTGGGGAWRVHEGDGGQEPTGTGYLRMRSGKADELSVPRALQPRVAAALHRLQLKPWEDGGLSALFQPRQPIQLIQLHWQSAPPADVLKLLPEGSIVTSIAGTPLHKLFNPPEGSVQAPRTLNSVADDVLQALCSRGTIELARAAPIEDFEDAAVAAPPINRIGLELCTHGAIWLWFYHPQLSPSPRETTGYPKACVPGMLEGLLRAAAPSVEGEAAGTTEAVAAGMASSVPGGDNAARRATTLSCLACSSRVGQDPGRCALPGKDGLPEELAYCMACSGKAARKKPETRRACCRRGFKAKFTLGRVHGRHWPLRLEETLQPVEVVELVASSALGGRHPSHWAARAANLGEAEARRSDAADAARHVNVISLLHDAHAQEGGAMDPKEPGGKPGRPPKEDSGISVTAKMLRGQLPSPTLNHNQRHVKKQLEELVAAGEAARFSRELASGARPLSEALAEAEPWLSTAPPEPAAGVGAHAARQQRAERNEAAKKQQQREHAIKLKLVQARRRREDVKRRVQNSQYCIHGRAGVQKSAGVSRAAPPDGEMQMLFAELETEEKEVARQEAELAKARATTLAGPARAALRSQAAGPSSSGAQQRVTDSLASAAKLGDYALMDAGNDNKYADGAKIDGRQRRYYLLRVTGRPRVLSAPLKNDWGTLQPGDHVLDGEYYYLVYKAHPTNSISARWYTTGQPPRPCVGVPTHMLLCVGFAMPLAVLRNKSSPQQRSAVERGAVVLPEDVHVRALTALRQRP